MFNCVCIDVDCPSFSRVSTRRAKIEHECCECLCKISPGSRYEYAFLVYDRKVYVYKTCLTCVVIREDHMECGYYYGMLWDTLSDIYGDYDAGEDDDDGPALDWLNPKGCE